MFIHRRLRKNYLRLLLGGNFDDSWFVDDACRTISFLNDADDPCLISFLLFDVFAVGSSLFTRQADEQSSRRFSRMTLQQLKHVSTSFRNSCHFGNDRQIVDDERDFVLLMRSECLSVPQQTKTSDICGSVSVVFMHKTRCCSVQTCHRIHRAMICLTHIFFGHDQLQKQLKA